MKTMKADGELTLRLGCGGLDGIAISTIESWLRAMVRLRIKGRIELDQYGKASLFREVGE